MPATLLVVITELSELLHMAPSLGHRNLSKSYMEGEGNKMDKLRRRRIWPNSRREEGTIACGAHSDVPKNVRREGRVVRRGDVPASPTMRFNAAPLQTRLPGGRLTFLLPLDSMYDFDKFRLPKEVRYLSGNKRGS